jgi:hypothetical protein
LYEWNEHMKNIEYRKEWIVVNDEEKWFSNVR